MDVPEATLPSTTNPVQPNASTAPVVGGDGTAVVSPTLEDKAALRRARETERKRAKRAADAELRAREAECKRPTLDLAVRTFTAKTTSIVSKQESALLNNFLVTKHGRYIGISVTPHRRRFNFRRLAAFVRTPSDHPAIDPKSSAREQEPPNKHYVNKALEGNALVPPPSSPPKGHQPWFRKMRSQYKSRRKCQDRPLESLNNTPGTASKVSTTNLALIPRKATAARVERAKSPPAKKRWTDASS
ncbi:hypothetical protein HPB51_025566 [Rhipicephalus microplus]|uniref:Uncharacterized protein n=1 Tax=Rhipicephalus microplus TaxID=6941 RepID=A0A9J6F954_RHIMP|nr:hypothetical protein HPB51_025566 [Rhipicephalus microplus]